MHKVKDVTISIVEESAPNIPLGKSEIVRAVLVSTCKELECKNGIIIQFNDKATVFIIQ
jgi:large subunit ribosomal protein L14